MTGTLAPAIPTLGDPNSTEDADVRNSLITLRDGLNAVLTSANGLDPATIAANSLALSKLVNGTSGQLLVANGSGVWTAVSSSGDVTVSNTGAHTIGTGAVTQGKYALTVASNSAGTSGTIVNAYSTLVSVTGLISGASYLCFGNVTSVSAPDLQLRCTSGATVTSVFAEIAVAGACAAGVTNIQTSGTQIDLQAIAPVGNNTVSRSNLLVLRYI